MTINSCNGNSILELGQLNTVTERRVYPNRLKRGKKNPPTNQLQQKLPILEFGQLSIVEEDISESPLNKKPSESKLKLCISEQNSAYEQAERKCIFIYSDSSPYFQILGPPKNQGESHILDVQQVRHITCVPKCVLDTGTSPTIQIDYVIEKKFMVLSQKEVLKSSYPHFGEFGIQHGHWR